VVYDSSVAPPASIASRLHSSMQQRIYHAKGQEVVVPGTWAVVAYTGASTFTASQE